MFLIFYNIKYIGEWKNAFKLCSADLIGEFSSNADKQINTCMYTCISVYCD